MCECETCLVEAWRSVFPRPWLLSCGDARVGRSTRRGWASSGGCPGAGKALCIECGARSGDTAACRGGVHLGFVFFFSVQMRGWIPTWEHGALGGAHDVGLPRTSGPAFSFCRAYTHVTRARAAACRWTDNRKENGSASTATGIELNGNDHYIDRTIVFSSHIGVQVGYPVPMLPPAVSCYLGILAPPPPPGASRSACTWHCVATGQRRGKRADGRSRTCQCSSRPTPARPAHFPSSCCCAAPGGTRVVFSSLVECKRHRSDACVCMQTWNLATPNGGTGILVAAQGTRLEGCYLDYNDLIIQDPNMVTVIDSFLLCGGQVRTS
jgi:hypothetical protein